MIVPSAARALAIVACLALSGAWALAQQEPVRPIVPPPPQPPPSESEKESSNPASPLEDLVPHGEEARWGLDPGLLQGLARRAESYREYATRFTCLEVARSARYYENGEASHEEVDRFSYLLQREDTGVDLVESRRRVGEGGEVHGGDVEASGSFPPSYGWVFLFSRFNQPYFSYRQVGEGFEGFHWVRTSDFKGALPFTDGRDIRQWEGTALVDAVTLDPIEIEAEPTAQGDRIRAEFDRWSQAFNLIGAHLAPRPFAYRCHVQFRFEQDGLTFPTELRYDTWRAVSRKQVVPVAASVRTYVDYRFFRTRTTEQTGQPTGNP